MSSMVAPAPPMYHGGGQFRNTAEPVTKLSTGAASLLRWLARWAQQTGESLFPSTGYLAKKQGKTERTIYRWLAELRAAGAIQTEVLPGVERRIVPLLDPSQCPPARRRRASRVKKMSGVLSGVLSGVTPYSGDACTENDNKQSTRAAEPQPGLTDSPAVRELVAVGIAPTVAAGLVRSHGEESCREQVKALAYRKADNPVGLLVKAIKGAWSLPDRIQQERKQAAEQADKARRMAAERQKASEQAKYRAELLERFSGLSLAQQSTLTQQAESLWRKEQPNAARIMGGTSAGERVIQSYVLRLLESEAANG